MPSSPCCGPAQSPVRAVLFDLDGTLTRPYFDFDAIRREIGLPTEPWTPILEALQQMTPEARARAEAILHRHEQEAADASELQEGALEVVDAIRRHGLAVGLLTRNSRRPAETVIAKHGLRFDLIHSREDGPVKPAPDPVLAMCRQLGVAPHATWVVGDFLFDLESGKAAGATTVLMIGESPRPDYSDRADHVIRRLRELLPLLSIPAADSAGCASSPRCVRPPGSAFPALVFLLLDTVTRWPADRGILL